MQILTPTSTNEFPMPDPVLSADEAVLATGFPIIVPESTNEFPMPPVVTEFYDPGAAVVEPVADLEPVVDPEFIEPTEPVVDSESVGETKVVDPETADTKIVKKATTKARK